MDTSLLKQTARPLLRFWKKATRPLYLAAFPRAYKQNSEYAYWRGRLKAEHGTLSNAHYEPLFTTVFGLSRDDYSGKRVIDIGCGPRGSLEWATMAAQRIGLDPLVGRYRRLGSDRHSMQYVEAPSEHCPFPDEYFDIVTCLNALDHVDDFHQTIGEIKRITASGGLFLVSVEIDHPPSGTEPITISEQDMGLFSPEFTTLMSFRVGTPADHDLHRAVQSRQPPYVSGLPGIYVAMMRKV